jgi:hypothetical protein
LVAGSAIFKAENPEQYIKQLRTLGEWPWQQLWLWKMNKPLP